MTRIRGTDDVTDGQTLTPELVRRIEGMCARDTIAAAGFVVVLWLVIAFVFVQMRALAAPAVSGVLLVAGAMVMLFNSASITAMIRHYRREKHRIYALDIEHLDAMRAGNPDALGLPPIDELVPGEPRRP
jgi:hypothetical protein